MNLHASLVQTVGRITLTKTQLEILEVHEFVELLVKIAADGVIEYEELELLTDWLNNHSESQVLAIRFMFDLMIAICADGKITDEEIFEVQLAIERILPKEFRDRIVAKRKTVYYSQPASENQLDLIEKFQRKRPVGLTRAEASEVIDGLFQNPPASNRQIMFLRFCNRMDLSHLSKREIVDWMDEFINQNPLVWKAWNLFKKESSDDGEQNDPSFVPIGAGEKYLQKIRESEL
jgi:hypothetical protein